MVCEKLHSEAKEHLAKARDAMKKLSCCTSDWSAGVILQIEFDSIEESCDDFLHHQFGVPRERKNETVFNS